MPDDFDLSLDEVIDLQESAYKRTRALPPELLELDDRLQGAIERQSARLVHEGQVEVEDWLREARRNDA